MTLSQSHLSEGGMDDDECGGGRFPSLIFLLFLFSFLLNAIPGPISISASFIDCKSMGLVMPLVYCSGGCNIPPAFGVN